MLVSLRATGLEAGVEIGERFGYWFWKAKAQVRSQGLKKVVKGLFSRVFRGFSPVMSTRVPVQHYNLRSANSFIGSSLHDLNTVDARSGEIGGISDVERDAVTEDSLENDDGSNSVDCMHESYRNSLPLHGVGVEEDRPGLENSGSSRSPYDILTTDDVLPIETTRARFLETIVDHFIKEHVIEVAESEADYSAQSGQEKLNKRKSKEVQYEGDPSFVLPLMYVANLYESLVNDVNMRLASINGMREKTIGVALEAAGSCTFKRRELATSLETRTRFPELVIQEEKRVRFVVVNGLVIDEKPNSIPIEEAEWFKRLTGRHEVAVSPRDYKFYSPRHKYRRVASHSVSNIPGLPPFSGVDSSSVMSTAPGYRPVSEGISAQEETDHEALVPPMIGVPTISTTGLIIWFLV
ncbi:hypothetical protein HHK36_006613 [Tetracentron sinense]|uniref:Uncharacterized protein n=1 Tax=Tetracentron sinense TaxID=13715 RepID=A0A835DPA9_TETSI|nr:hypothetical protein HHK36_006613 [Tetracentron sinense]